MSFIESAINSLVKNEDLTYEMAKGTMDEIMKGEASDIQISSYLTALSIKGESIQDITASATSLRENGTKLDTNCSTFEIVGTGGDGSDSFNISTVSSIVIASSGVKVTKHGNRAASSKCGAADVLEALGVKIDLEPEESLKVLNEINIAFLFAQKYHSSMRFVAPVRAELAIPTIFNILGPLANPAAADIEIMGVYSEDLVKPLAITLKNLGVKKAMVVYGQDKIDEISISAPTTVCEVNGDEVLEYEINPEDYGMELASKEDIKGGDPKENAEIALNILKGEKGPKRDVVLLNSGAGLYFTGKANSIEEGIEYAKELIDSGKALEQLEKFIECSNKF